MIDNVGAAYTAYVMLHYGLALAATMYLTRVVGAGVAGQIVAALVLVFGGSFCGLSYGMTLITTFAWAPLILGLLLRAFERRSYLTAVLAGVLQGIQLLGVNPHAGFFVLLLIALAVLLEARGPDRWSRFWFAVKATLLAESIALGLGAPQVFYLLQFMSQTDRGAGLPYAEQVTKSLPPHHFLQLLIPNMFGVGDTMSAKFHTMLIEMKLYCGLLTLGFVVLGWRAPHRFVAWAKGALTIGVVLALGRFVGVYHVLGKLPGFSQLHFPCRFLMVASLGAAVLAGVGLDRLISGQVDAIRVRKRFVWTYAVLCLGLLAVGVMSWSGGFEDRLQNSYHEMVNWGLDEPLDAEPNAQRYANFTRSVFIASLLSACCGAYWLSVGRVSRHWMAGAAIALLSVDLLVCVAPSYHYGPKGFYAQTPPHLEYLRSDESQWRALRVYDEFEFVNPQPGGLAFNEAALFEIDALNYNSAADRRDLSSFIGPQWSLGDATTLKHLALLNVKYLLMTHPLPEGGEKELNLTKRFSAEGWWIYELDESQPRVMIREQPVFVENLDHTKHVINSDEFSLNESVTLEDFDGVFTPGETFQLPASDSKAKVLSYGAQEVVIEAQLARPGILILSDLYYPGWNATSNGRSVKILAANGIVRGLALGPGLHRVVFSFEPASFYLGLCLAATTSVLLILGLLGMFLVRQFRARTRSSSPT